MLIERSKGASSNSLRTIKPPLTTCATFSQQTCCENPYVSLPFDHPIYVLFSSGTTGVPKGIVHGTGGTLLQHAKELLLHSDVKPGDVVFFYTTCGWMMWNWLISNLMLEQPSCCTTARRSHRGQTFCSRWLISYRILILARAQNTINHLRSRGVAIISSVSLIAARRAFNRITFVAREF